MNTDERRLRREDWLLQKMSDRSLIGESALQALKCLSNCVYLCPSVVKESLPIA